VTKREKILSTMLSLISTQGAHATPMSQIAKEADVATGTIYHHFNSKEDIINELHVELKKEFGAIVSESLNDELEYFEQFTILWASLYDYYLDNPLKFYFVEQISNSPLIDNKSIEKGKMHHLPMLNFIRKGMSQGLLREQDTVLSSSLVYGNILTVVQLTLNNQIEVDHKILKDAIESSWRSIKA